MEDFHSMTIPNLDGCLIVPNNTCSFFAVTIDGKQIPLKRVAYRLAYGNEGDCAWLDNICGNPLCFNPEHLIPHVSVKDGGGRHDLNEPISAADSIRFWSKTCWDDRHRCREWSGSLRVGYGVFGLGGQTYGAHRVAYRIANGYIPEDLWIDHICRNPKCVNPNHLRLCTPELNRQNIAEATNSRSGHLNVSWSTSDKRWSVDVVRKGISYHGGEYINLEDAVRAARKLRNSISTFNEMDRMTPII
ncbi:HNH endonuclease signature motif containing protein [Bifidobacterium sp. SO1]|uniref:HNH endonuclease signature motif containing protein n=1 Tax=Bifidobacterium sp. SO1 TaxID=2809029 RepID=UPI001BDD1A77|nr:HNH endonuclease signature motif containing protein [Bifidobacterium sp. SO1]MBT1162553.1 HNH endonuclease [Bifidobacterium sp. SO1]